MEIKVKVIGADEKHNGLYIAKGTADGEDCIVTVKQKGYNAVLALHSDLQSTIGTEAVISYKGNIVCKGAVSAGKELVFKGLTASLKPTKIDREANIAKNTEQLKQVATIVAEQSEVIQTQQAQLESLQKEIEKLKAPKTAEK
jgi:hypothetical protein